MKNLNSWQNPSDGFYRFYYENLTYEILITKWNHKDDILDAFADLYLFGVYHRRVDDVSSERECLVSGVTVRDCLREAWLHNLDLTR